MKSVDNRDSIIRLLEEKVRALTTTIGELQVYIEKLEEELDDINYNSQ